MAKRYINAAETAKLVRQALRESFPGVKFSVRSDSYSMGSAVRIRWQDGPTTKQVQSVAGCFDGTYFDGMIDYAGSKYHRLDGEIVHFHPSINCTRDSGPASDAFKAAWAKLDTHERWQLCRKLGAYPWRGDADQDDAWWSALSAYSFFAGEPQHSPTLDRVSFYGDDGYGAGTVGTPDRPGGSNGYSIAGGGTNDAA